MTFTKLEEKCIGKRTKFKFSALKSIKGYKTGGNNNLLNKLYTCGSNARNNCHKCNKPLCNACMTKNRHKCLICKEE